MKCVINLLVLVCAALVLSCGSAPKTGVSEEDSRVLHELVTAKQFRVESDWASPLTTTSINMLSQAQLIPAGSTPGRINLIGNQNFLEVRGDTVMAYLPYYGEQQMSTGYGNSGNAIEFKAVPSSYIAERTQAGSAYEVRFQVRNAMESFRVLMVLYPNLRSSITVNSTHRTSIRYDGKLNSIPK